MINGHTVNIMIMNINPLIHEAILPAKTPCNSCSSPGANALQVPQSGRIPRVGSVVVVALLQMKIYHSNNWGTSGI